VQEFLIEGVVFSVREFLLSSLLYLRQLQKLIEVVFVFGVGFYWQVTTLSIYYILFSGDHVFIWFVGLHVDYV
jgi:hypothetical protein